MNPKTRELLERVAQLKVVRGDYLGMNGGMDVYDRDRYLVKEVQDVVKRAKIFLDKASKKLKHGEAS